MKILIAVQQLFRNSAWVMTIVFAVAASPVVAQCTSCTTLFDGEYTVHTFQEDGSFTVPAGVISVEYLVVGGGGGGGAGDEGNGRWSSPGGGNGGDGGEVASGSLVVTPLQGYAIDVGDGGDGSSNGNREGESGEPSSFASITAAGGDGGGTSDGYDGGQGGDGAGTAGTTGNGWEGGAGGDGTQSSITGNVVSYGGGGGGGGVYAQGGVGGQGGGGNGGTADDGENAIEGTGGGGGGGGLALDWWGGWDAHDGGNGGSGVVVVRYLTPIVPPASCGDGEVLTPGLLGYYYDFDSGDNPPTRPAGTPDATRVDNTVNFDSWGDTSGPDLDGFDDNYFKIRWEGLLRVNETGVYRFSTNSDDGVRLEIGGVVLVDEWNDHAAETHEGTVTLVAGESYSVRLEYYEWAGFAVIGLSWEPPGGALTVIPAGSTTGADAGLYHCAPMPAPVAEYRLDELAWNGGAGEVVDYSANGLHGQAVDQGGLPPTQKDDPALAGNPGTCRSGNFAATDGFLVIDDPGVASPLDLTEYSVTAWVYARSLPPSGGLSTIVSKDENYEFHVNPSGQIYWWWGGENRQLTTSAQIATGAWHHIAVTYRSGSQAIYIDGVRAATGTASSAVTLNNDPLYIGTDIEFLDRRFDGYIDEVRIYNTALSQSQVSFVMNDRHACPAEPTIDHFDISAVGGSTCVPAAVMIAAKDANGNTLTDYTGSINLAASSNNGDWSATGNASDAAGVLTPGTADSGEALYAFESGGFDNGDVTLNLANAHAETLTIVVTDVETGVFSESLPVVFGENAFVVSATDSLADDVIAGRNHNFTVEMIRRDPDTGRCGVALGYDAGAIKAWVNRTSEDPGGAPPQLRNSDASATVVLPNSVPSSPNFDIGFQNGVADVTLATSDVGRYGLLFRDDDSGFSDSPIVGGSGTFVVRPFAFEITAADNPGASNENGSVFTVAGANFTVNARALAWQAADDSDGDGIADATAVLQDNAPLAGFGQEVPSEGITISAQTIAPTGPGTVALGLASALPSPSDGRNITAFVNGAGATSDVFFPEVGIIQLSGSVLDGDYLGSGTYTTRIRGRSGPVGRFVPAHFIPAVEQINEGCDMATPFTYMAQPFTVEYRLAAVNTRGDITQNYHGPYVKLTTDGQLGWEAYDWETSQVLDRLDEGGISTLFDWSSGTGSLTSTIVFERPADPDTDPDGPFGQVSIGVTAADSDGVTIAAAAFNLDTDGDATGDHFDLGQTAFRFGRLYTADAFGPETADLPAQLVTQYWDDVGDRWLNNSDDSCTRVDTSLIEFNDQTLASSTAIDVGAHSGATQANWHDPNLADGFLDWLGGEGLLSFQGPGASVTGSFVMDISLVNHPWLRYDWDQTDGHDDIRLKRATFTFGSYRGHDRVIYWREVLQ